jgi:hypothetical protein
VSRFLDGGLQLTAAPGQNIEAVAARGGRAADRPACCVGVAKPRAGGLRYAKTQGPYFDRVRLGQRPQLAVESGLRQREAIVAWWKGEGATRARLPELDSPALVANGVSDVMAPADIGCCMRCANSYNGSMSPLCRALFLSLACALALDAARADENDISLGGFVCVAPFLPACVDQPDALGTKESVSACQRELDSFVAMTAAYRTCLEDKISAAVRRANDALDHFRCLSQSGACSSAAKRATNDARPSSRAGQAPPL